MRTRDAESQRAAGKPTAASRIRPESIAVGAVGRMLDVAECGAWRASSAAVCTSGLDTAGVESTRADRDTVSAGPLRVVRFNPVTVQTGVFRNESGVQDFGTTENRG